MLIHRADALPELMEACGRRLGAVHLRFVHPEAEAPAIRVLVSARKGSRAPLVVLPPLVLHGPEGRFTDTAARLHAGQMRLPMRPSG
ncbi:MAG: methyltransferase [Beijerinckiaceae bacterium]|nr:MAG: methyltransferase [Beijerinckiaceae bacterium]